MVFGRRERLAVTGGVSREELERARLDLSGARDARDAAAAQLDAAGEAPSLAEVDVGALVTETVEGMRTPPGVRTQIDPGLRGYTLLADPEVVLIGIPERNGRGESIEDLVYNAVVDTAENMPRARKRDPDSLAESVRRAARAAVAQDWGKKPVCVVHVLQA